MMQIVIDIPKKVYDRFKEKDHIKKCDVGEYEKALYKCIILPKGHGRLIDENDLWFEDIDDISCVTHRNVENATTIIEADKR